MRIFQIQKAVFNQLLEISKMLEAREGEVTLKGNRCKIREWSSGWREEGCGRMGFRQDIDALCNLQQNPINLCLEEISFS